MSDFQPKFLHCRIRVRDLQRSVSFYTEMFGFHKSGEHASPAGNQLVFLSLPGGGTQIELCYQPNSADFSFPEDIFHFAFNTPDLDAFERSGSQEELSSGRSRGLLTIISTS